MFIAKDGTLNYLIFRNPSFLMFKVDKKKLWLRQPIDVN
jgi:hypothetical protein